MNLLMSLYMLLVTLVAVAIPGLLVSSFLMREEDEEYFWPLLPFLGISTSILVLQNLVYLGVPIGRAAPSYLLVTTILLAVYWYRTKSRVPTFPRALAVIAILVLAVHGIGYWTVGAKHYLGYAWLDSNTYTATTQFLMDRTYATGWADIGNTPYLVKAILQKSDRLGQSVVQGLVATVGGTNARSAWGMTSLLGPVLTTCALWTLVRNSGMTLPARYAAVASSSLVPGVALIHLECFLSQAMAVPFLLVWPVVVDRLFEKMSFRRLVVGMLLFAAANSIYTEYTLLLVGTMSVVFLWHVFRSTARLALSASLAALVVGAIALNPGYARILRSLFERVNVVNVLAHIYPYAFKVEGLTRLWFGLPILEAANGTGVLLWLREFPRILGVLAAAQAVLSVTLTAAAAAGLVSVFVRRRNAVTLALLAITSLPIVILARQNPMPYQFYKILLSVSPLLVFGVFEIASLLLLPEPVGTGAGGPVGKRWSKAARKTFWVGVVIVLTVEVAATAELASYSSTGRGRSIVKLVNDGEMVKEYDRLEGLRGGNLLLTHSHPFPLGWMAYHARRTSSWITVDEIGDVRCALLAREFSFQDLSTLPRDARVEPVNVYPRVSPEKLARRLSVVVQNPQGMEGERGQEFNWLGKKMEVRAYLLGDREVNVAFGFHAAPGPVQVNPERTIEVRTEAEIRRIDFSGDTDVSIPLVLKPGASRIEFVTLYPEKADFIPPADQRELLVLVSGMTIQGAGAQ